MYRVQRAEADRLHGLRRSAQAAAQRAERKGQEHKALEMWQHAENLKVHFVIWSHLSRNSVAVLKGGQFSLGNSFPTFSRVEL